MGSREEMGEGLRGWDFLNGVDCDDDLTISSDLDCVWRGSHLRWFKVSHLTNESLVAQTHTSTVLSCLPVAPLAVAHGGACVREFQDRERHGIDVSSMKGRFRYPS